MTYRNDIPTSLAQSAHSGTSFVPETRAQQERDAYDEHLRNIRSWIDTIAKKHGTEALADAEFERYRDGYRRRYSAHLAARSRCLSTMIAGPSGFDSRRNEKRFAAERKRSDELTEWSKRARKSIGRTLCPGTGPIMSGDSDACERLAEKIAKAEKDQALMKDCNKAIRKHKKSGVEAQVAALVELGVNEKLAREIIEPDFCGRVGFADCELKNNNANIRRMKRRLAGLQAVKAQEATSVEGVGGITLEDDPPANRVRLYFPDKPEASMRAQLKAHGFRWAPSVGAWQAYRSRLEFAKLIAGVKS